MHEMTAMEISAMLGQWVGAAVCFGAAMVCLIGINIEYKYKASRGHHLITLGSVIFGIGCFIFAVATKMLGW